MGWKYEIQTFVQITATGPEWLTAATADSWWRALLELARARRQTTEWKGASGPAPVRLTIR